MAYGLDLTDFEDKKYDGFGNPISVRTDIPAYKYPAFSFTGLNTTPTPSLSTTTGDSVIPSTSEFVQKVATPNKPPRFVDWWKNMEPDKKAALTRGLLSTGLNMMALGGRTYDRPVSALGIIGQAGQAGLKQYEDTYDREQAHGLRKEYLDLAKERNKTQREVYGLKLDAAKNAAINKLDDKKMKALKRIAQIDEKIAKYAKNNAVVDSEAAKLLQLYGKNVSMGSTMDEESRQHIINSYNKERQALLPLTRTMEEKIAGNTPLSNEEKRNIYRETYGIMKSGADKAMGLNTEPEEKLKKEWELYE